MIGPILALVGGGALLWLMGRSSPTASLLPPPAPGQLTTMPVAPRPPNPSRPPVQTSTWLLEPGRNYNITQAVHDVPDAVEMLSVVQSMQDRGHTNVITAKNRAVPTEWVLNYDSFPLQSQFAINRGQQSKVGPYSTSVLDVRNSGDLDFFNGTVNA